jgi:uncharacterized protein (TIGR02231 family)
MKNVILLFCLVFMSSILTGQENEVNIKTEIKNVTVFPKSAQVERVAKTTIPSGENEMVFTDISPNIVGASIQFKGKGEFTILSVYHRFNYIKPKEIPEKIQKLKDQQKTLRETLELEKAHLEAIALEENMILANKEIGSQQNGVNAQDLAAVASFFREHFLETKKAKLEINKRTAKLNEQINDLQKQINEYNAANTTKTTSEVVVAYQAKKKVEGIFNLQYIVNQAGWKPIYDLRVEDVNNPVGLTYKAMVYQNSGEDWNDVALKLATGNPSLGGTKPTMSTWWLSQGPSAYNGRQKMKRAVAAAPTPESYEYVEEDMADADYVEVEQIERTTFTEFVIQLPQTIPADGKQYQINIAAHQLPADYVYYAAPKLDKNAFLTARITGWEDFDLLSGQASLFFEGTFLGKSWIDVGNFSDTLDLSLGRDAGIVIKREKDKQFKDKQFIGRKVTKTIGWNIELRNTKSHDIDIIIEDQIPVSTTEEIEVALENAKGAKVTEANGMLRWEFTLKSGKTEKLGFKYSVKYPKGINLVLE